MKQRLRRPLALLLTVVMLLGLLPTAAFAVEEPGEPAAVTVNETEPVPPSESENLEGGQEPPESNEPSGGEPEPVEPSGEPGNALTQPSADNGGEPEPGDPGDVKDGDAQITSLKLKNFTSFGEATSGDLNLLNQEGPVQWDLFSPYTLEVGVSVPAGSSENKVTITLPEGMKFVNLNPANITGDGIDSASWKKGDYVYSYQPNNGTLTVNLTSNAEKVTLSVSVQPDIAFFSLEDQENGHSIENAIQVEVTSGNNAFEHKSVDITVKTSVKAGTPYIGDIPTSNFNVVAGGTATLGGNPYVGWFGSAINYRLVEKQILTLYVPKGLTITSNVWTVQNSSDSDKEGYDLYTFTAEEIYGNRGPNVDFEVTVPDEAEVGTVYDISLKSVSLVDYGKESPVTYTPSNLAKWTITVKDPAQVELVVTAIRARNVYNFTKMASDTGTFDDYQTVFASSKITNEGVGAINEPLIYEAEFGQNVQFVTAVGIPCGWSTNDDQFMPTKITVVDQEGKTTEISGTSAIRNIAFIPYDNQGFVLRAVDLAEYGFDTSKSIKSVKVELKGLPEGYVSSDYSPIFEGSNRHNVYAGVWGRVRETISNTTDTNQFRIYPESTSEDKKPDYISSVTTIAETGKYSGISPSNANATKITIGGATASTAAPGQVIHIRNTLGMDATHGGTHTVETICYAPVIYLLEPEDLSIENVVFTLSTGNDSIPYKRTDLTGQVGNLLPNGYKLYQYELNEKITIGYWDKNWNNTILYVDYDYRVDSAAKTWTYDVQKLFLFKSSLDMAPFVFSIDDTYSLNNGTALGGIPSKSFTVQAAPTFSVATAIQIEGENKWYSYNPEDEANTTSVFTEGATANVRVTVTNNSGGTVSNTEVYIPVPKKDQASMLGEHFISETGFDMFIADKADLTGASGWDVQYGQVTEVKLGDNGVPTGEFELNRSWSDEYDASTNMIKLSLSRGMANGTSAEIILKFKATDDTSQTDSMNIFKSWYKYSTGDASMVDTEKVYNFGTLLQNGQLDGTVYLDANRNGKMDEDETGVEDVTIKVTDSEGRTYETQTGEGGAYSFNSLPGSKKLTLTVTNPSSPDPNSSGGSYRFYGGDVTPAEDNRSASKSGFTLEGGAATVNAGLITPYKVEFKIDSQDGVVSPESVCIYADTELSEVVKAVYVVSAGSGRTFTNQWKVGEDATDLIDHEELLDQTVTADTTFTAITSTAQCVVTFQHGAGQFTGDDAAKESITKNYDLNDTISSSDFPTVTHPQGNQLIGWTYNGETKTAEGWNNTPVTSDMTFTAQFAGDVTLTLIANGGQFASDAQTTFTGAAGTEITVPTPTRTGWTFAGWYTAENGGDKIENPNVLPTASAIWYAHWTKGVLMVTVNDTPTYDGTPQEPDITVKIEGATLTSKQYVAIWSNNINAGTDKASVTVHGLDEYAGLSGTATFSINKANQTVTFAKPGEQQTATYGESFSNTATAQLDSAKATISYSSDNTGVATVDKNGTVTIHKSGTVTITATAKETDNVKEGEATYKLTIGKANPTLTFANSTVSVKTTGSVSNTLTIVPKDLTVTYTSSKEDVAKVDSSTGTITLVGEGNATITANFAGNDCYNAASASYTLTVDNDAIAYTAEGWYGPYDGTPHGITVNVTTPADGATVTYKTTEDGLYTAVAPTYTDAGTYTVYFQIEAAGYDTVTGSAKVVINKAMLTDATVTGGEYTGKAVGSVSEVKAGTLVVPEGSYEVFYVNNVDAGTAVAIITAKAGSNFIGNVPKTFTITPKQLTADMVSPIADQPYTGDQITPTVTVTDGAPLVEGKDFTVSYGNNNTVGTNAGTVTIKGTGNYAGEVKVNFNITNTGAFKVIVDNSEHTYNGSEHTPTVVVYAVDKAGVMTPLTVDTDYEVTYANNTNAGAASVTVTGMGAYASWEDAKASFTIQRAEQSVTFADMEVEKTYGEPAFTQAATVALNPDVDGQATGAVTYASNNPAVATVDSTGKVTIVGAGTVTITASAAATDNYKRAEASYKLTVNPKDISSEDVTASQIPDQPYGGVPVTPEFSLTDSDNDISKHNLEVNVDYTFEYSNNDGEGEGKITITGKGNYTGKKEVIFKIISWSESMVIVTPAPITIYMGGADGYEGAVVDEETGAIKASSSLPEPGFLFTLPEMLKEALETKGETITAVKFYELASGKEWTVEPYAEGSSTVYRLVPSGTQEPVRVQFTNAQGQTVTEDKFEVGENINQTLTMTLYKGDVGVIYAIYDGVQYPIRLGKSTLTVRGVTDEAQYATVTDVTTAPVEGKPAVTAESGTSYTINGSDVPVEDTTGVALLFDSIIDASGEDRTGLLEDKAESAMAALGKEPASGNRFAYSFQYLDLVDTNNGNAWVKASQDVTIYWPYPAGTDKNTEFTLLHFEGLHREMESHEIGDQIADCNVRKVTIVKKTETHIVFKAGSAGFSPFALVWEEKIPTYTITATSNGNGSITPAGVTTVQEGGSQSYTIKADSGYHISDVKVNGKSVGAVESYDFTDIRSNQTIEVTFARNSSGGTGGGGVTTRYTIEAEAGQGGEISPDGRVSVSSGSDKTFRITADEGYEIADVIVDGKSVGAVSSYTFENVRKNHTISVTFQEAEQVADPDDTGVSGWLNTKDHIQYLSGYGGGKFGPTDNMTRAQAAQMFYNLLLDKNVPITVRFTDVAADAWYAQAVNTLASLGIVNGVGSSQFAPERAITRAEFTVIAMRFAHLDTTGENIFSDVKPDDWFYAQVVGSIQYGWITGYTDGTFRPGSTITRAEVTTIVNRMLGRSADKAFVDSHADTLTQFDDVSRTYWAYYQIMEATNAHDYKMVNGVEDWTRLQ